MMIEFISAVKNILEESGTTIDIIFEKGVISKNTFYKYRHRNPSLKTLIKVANFMCVSIDYLYELSDTNNFKKYSQDQRGFYQILQNYINKANLSNRQFCKELNYQKDALTRYKQGVYPSLRTLFEIASFFGCSVDDLLVHE